MPDKVKLKFKLGGIAGLHLTINPQSPVSPEAKIFQHFIGRDVILTDAQMKALMKGRSEGIASMDNLLGLIIPGISANTRLKLSTKLADTLMSRSLIGQLSREAPTALERVQQRDAVLRSLFQQPVPPAASRGQVPQLFNLLPPVGATLTIHF